MKQTFYLLLIAVASLTIFSCGSNTTNEEGTTTKSEEIAVDTALIAGQGEDLAPYEITKAEALPRIWSYQSGNPEPSASNPNLVKIPLNEFQIMANNLEEDGAYAVLSKNGDNFEIIFVGKDKNGSGEWRYFDFVQPCPPVCGDTTRISSN